MRRRLFVSSTMTMLAVAISLSLIGTSYARWTKRIVAYAEVETGDFDIRFDNTKQFDASIISTLGNEPRSLFGSNEIIPSFDPEMKKLSFKISDSLLLDELVDETRMIMLRFPLSLTEESAVKFVKSTEVDFDKASQEHITFVPTKARMIISGEEFELFGSTLSYSFPLTWDVYRQVETDGETIIGKIFLKLSPESKQSLISTNTIRLSEHDVPLNLAERLSEQSEGSMADVIVEYTFSIPLYVDQAFLTEEEYYDLLIDV